MKQFSELVNKIAYDVMQTADKNKNLNKNRLSNNVAEMESRSRKVNREIELTRE